MWFLLKCIDHKELFANHIYVNINQQIDHEELKRPYIFNRVRVLFTQMIPLTNLNRKQNDRRDQMSTKFFYSHFQIHILTVATCLLLYWTGAAIVLPKIGIFIGIQNK